MADSLTRAEFRVREANSELERLSERLREAVAGAGQQGEIAAAAGVSLTTLKNYMAGSDPKLGSLSAIAKATNVRLEWLATGEGPMRPGDPAPTPLQAPPEPAKPLRLFAYVHMDTLASAYSAALAALASLGIDDAPPRRVMQLTTEIYDLLRHEEEAQNPKE